MVVGNWGEVGSGGREGKTWEGVSSTCRYMRAYVISCKYHMLYVYEHTLFR